jgi:hypothetical protein
MMIKGTRSAWNGRQDKVLGGQAVTPYAKGKLQVERRAIHYWRQNGSFLASFS